MEHTHLFRLVLLFGLLAVTGFVAAERERRAAIRRRNDRS